jgi:hypothetical protein
VRVAAEVRVVGQAVCARETVLRCVVVGADSGGGLHWLKPMVEVACMHVCTPCRAPVWAMVVHH